MPCLFAIFAGFFPRVADIILWIARPTWFMAPFNGAWIWPMLGVIFLPFTTLFYVFMWTPGVGLTGWDWLWIGMAVFMDIANLAGHARTYQNRIPGYSKSTTPAAS
jgi:hypothetical protein